MVERRVGAGRVPRRLNLGYMYAKGLGTARNMPEAIRHFEAVALPADSSDTFLVRAAEQIPRATAALGMTF